jgi:hypothetical protein
MNRRIAIQSAALLALALIVYAASPELARLAQAQSRETYRESKGEAGEALEPMGDPGREFPVPSKPLPTNITPCRACHGPEKDFPVNFKRREDLLVHRDIRLNHGGVRVWCLDCHHPEHRNYLLPLSDGEPIPFERSYRLCGKCHGTKFRDWRNGVHGKRVGYWNGEKTYYLCVQCHNPHSPRFKPLEPKPPPRKPHTPKEAQRRS